jgi:RinA family phage transcriptional activator
MSEGKNKKNTWYQHTESLLYNRKSFPLRVISLRQEIEMIRELPGPSIVPNYELREGKNYSVSSPVEKAAIVRCDAILKIEREIESLEKMIKKIDDAINTLLNTEQRRLVDMKYSQSMTWQQICIELSIDKNTFYDLRNDIIKNLAWSIGKLPKDEAEKELGLFMEPVVWQ